MSKHRVKNRIELSIAALGSDDAAKGRLAEAYLIRRGSKARTRLLKSATESSKTTRFRIAYILGFVQGRMVHETLLKLARDEDPEVRYDAFVSIGRRKDKRSIPFVKSIAARPEAHGDGIDASSAAAALSHLGKCALDAFRELLQNPDRRVRSIAGWNIHRLKARGVVAELAQLLNDDEEKVVIGAIESLGIIGAKRSRSLIKPFLDSPRENVKDVAHYWYFLDEKQSGPNAGRTFG